MTETSPKTLLAIVELGGYPDFRPLYRRLGYEVEVVTTMRKALSFLKRQRPAVVVAEFNYQSDFRDRTSSLESLMAVLQRMPETRLVVFFEREYQHQFERLRSRFSEVIEALAFPIEESRLAELLQVKRASPQETDRPNG
jgi:hypothetical protein